MIPLYEIGWTAGFLEGEGSFHFSKTKTLSVKAAQVQKWPLERLKLFFGGQISVSHRSNVPNRQPINVWEVSGFRAVQMVMTIYSLMSPRRQTQILSVLRQWKQVPLVRRSKYSPICTHGHWLSKMGTDIRGRCLQCKKEWNRCM